MYFGALSAALLVAFQFSGWVQDASFSILQRPTLDNLGHWGEGGENASSPLLKLPRLGLFRQVGDETVYDIQNRNVLKCQLHGIVMFVEFGERGPENLIDTCQYLAPIIMHVEGGGQSNLKHDINISNTDKHLRRFQRAIIFNIEDDIISLVSGSAGSESRSSTNNKNELGQEWYLGTDRAYGSVLVGTRAFPYAPAVDDGDDSNSGYFVHEAFFLPAGKALRIDAALFMPVHALGKHLNKATKSDSSRNNGTGSRGNKGSARVNHWPELCASMFTALQADLRVSGDAVSLSKPFLVTSSAAVGPHSSFARLNYWLDFCEAGSTATQVHLLHTLGGPQRYWAVDDDYNGDAQPPSSDIINTSSTATHAGTPSCVIEQMMTQGGVTPRKSRRACGALHAPQSPYSAQSPCDVKRVRNLGDGNYQQQEQQGSVVCLEDVLSSPYLHVTIAQGGETATESRSRTPLVFASSRGLADMWARDPALADSLDRSQFSHPGDFQRVHSGKVEEEKEDEEDGDSDSGLWWDRQLEKEKLRHLYDFRAHSLHKKRSSKGKRRCKSMHSLHGAGSDDVSTDLMSSSAGMLAGLDVDSTLSSSTYAPLPTTSLLEGRVEEFSEMLRVIHAFCGMHRVPSPSYSIPALPSQLRIKGLLSPAMNFGVSSGSTDRFHPPLVAAPKPPSGDATSVLPEKPAVSLRVQVAQKNNVTPRMCVANRALLASSANAMQRLLRWRNHRSVTITTIPGGEGAQEVIKMPPSPLQWELTVDEAVFVTKRQLDHSAYPRKVNQTSGEGVTIVHALGGTRPVDSRISLSQPPPLCDLSHLARGRATTYTRLLILHKMHRELAKFFKGGVFLCDIESGDDDATYQGVKSSLLYLCQSHNHADTGYARSYFARRLREVVSVLAPGGHVYYDLDQDDEEGTKGLYGRHAAATTARLGDEGGRLVRRLQALRGSSPEIIERHASSRAIVEALYAMCAAIEGTSAGTSDILGKTDDNNESKECPVPTRAGLDSLSPSELITLNQRLSGSDAHVFLFVLPEQFQVAQALVDRWHKACEGHNTCFLYVKTSVVVVHAEEASTTDDSYSWQEDMRRNARPSLRSSLLMLDDAMERGSLADDLIVVLVGMQAALSFAVPGTQHSVLIPPVEYGSDSRYGLNTPVMFASRASSNRNSSIDSSKEDCDPYAFAGAAWAVQIMLRSIRGQKEQSQYLHGDNTQVLGALRQYQRRHASWTSIDADSSIFNRVEGNRRWHYMTRPDALQVAKARALYLYAPNRNRTNNQYPMVIDIEDYSATANIDLVFNITYCGLASAMAADKREYLPWFNEAGTAKTAAHAENATSGDPISMGRWLWARKERSKCSSNRAHVLVLLWVGDIMGKHKISEPLSPRYYDDYEHVKGEEELVIPSSDGDGGGDPQPIWFIEEQSGGLAYSLHQTVSETNGYTSINNETAVHSSVAGPLSTFGQGVFAINLKSLPTFVSKVVDAMQQGMVMGSVALSMQLHRAYSLTFDANRDTYLQDIVLLKLAELTKYLPHFRQYSPLESYKNAVTMLTEHMSGRDGFPHMGLSPYSAWNWQEVQRDAPHITRHRSIHELELRFEDKDELDLNVRDKKNKEGRERAESLPVRRVNFTEYRRKQDTYGGKNKVSGEGRWGARGGSLASRLHSPATSVSLGPEEAPLILNLGEGRGPDTGTDVESYLSFMGMDSAHNARSSSDTDSGSGDVYWTRAFEYIQALSKKGDMEDGAPTLDGPSGTGSPSFASLQEPGAHLGPAGAGREALGNPFAVASYSVLAGLYSSIGPYHASITAYAKSIAHADYFTVASRRRRWHEQQQRQQRLLALVDAANGGGVKAAEAAATLQQLEQSPDRATHHPFTLHFVTMADRMSDRLSNLIFTAATSGVGLTVVGMKDEQSLNEDGATTKFNYADKVVAYYAHLSSGLRGGDIRPDDVVVFLDAYDVLLFPAARRIGRHLYHKSATPILFCAENGVYPEPASQYAHAYEGDDNGNGHPSRRYLNSGCIAGRAGQMFRMLQAAYDLRDSFRNDQQFYVKYALAHPDLVGLDRQSELFVTTHKGMSCRHTTIVSNALSLDYYFHPHSLPSCSTTTTGSVEERISPDVGVLHANNLASNRVYHVVTQAYKQAVDFHMRGADGSLLLEAVWALADRRYGRAAALLTAPEVQRNFTSQGGDNLLGDLLLVRYGSELGPHFVQISEELGLCGGSAGATVSVSVPPPFRATFDAQYGTTTHSTEAELQCSYFAHLFLRESLSSVNAARFQAGVSPLTGGVHTSMCPRPYRDNYDDSIRSSSSCRSWRRELGSYGSGDQAALALLQLSMGGGRGDEYMWETTGALFEMQQRHLTDSLRVRVDGCV